MGTATAVAVRWTDLGTRPLRTLHAGAGVAGRLPLVLVPGLGAIGYLRRLVQACATWTSVVLLDLPGFGDRRTAGCPADLPAVAEDVLRWLASTSAPDTPVLLAGHSTGAQAALVAARRRPAAVAALALLGPTFPPEARRWAPLVARSLATVRAEPRRLALARGTLPEYARGRSGVVTLLRSALADAPEAHVGEVEAPVLVARGAADRLCPERWAAGLADRAVRGRCATLPGSHNVVLSHADQVADVLRVAAGA